VSRVPTTDDEVCGPSAHAWAAACTAQGEGHVDALRCPPGHVVFSVTGPGSGRGAPVFVDAAAGAGGLRKIKGVSLSPIGEFADFSAAPKAVRDAFERVATCAERDPAIPLGDAVAVARPRDVPGSAGPWWVLAGVVLAVLALAPRRLPRAPWRTLRTLAALAGVVLLLARFLAGESFFHQNGHGPNWTGYALGEPCSYGPGYAELFGWAARLRPASPEPLLFACNAALAATWPVSTWVVARRAGASAALAGAIALAVAVDPLLWRIAFTESYYVPCTALVLAASAVALSVPTLRIRSPRFLVAHVAAGLLVAEAARVHPVVWIAVAVVPLAHIARAGSPLRSARRAAVGTAIVGGTVAITSGAAILRLLRGAMGDQYLPEVRHGWYEQSRVTMFVFVGGAILLGLAPTLRGRRFPRVAYAGLVIIGAAAGTSLLAIDVDWVRAAHARMFLASFVAAGLGLVGPWLRASLVRRWGPAIVAAAGALHAAVHISWATELPTDALELRRALVWRDRIAEGARLVTVETAGIMALQLPMHPAHGDGSHVVRLDVHAPPPELGSFGTDVYYYRSSLCSTAAARDFCDAVERSAPLEPVDVADLPARPSTHATTYEGQAVRVGLYHLARAAEVPTRL
jgi:hypothetical protein